MTNLSQSLSLCHLNIRSIKKNLSNFVTYMDFLGFRFSIIGLTETWMRYGICDLYGIEGYELFEKHRPTTAGGDVRLFIAQKLEYTKRDDLRYFDDMGDMISQSFFLDPVTPQEIAEIIKSLKNGAPGYDEINRFCCC